MDMRLTPSTSNAFKTDAAVATAGAPVTPSSLAFSISAGQAMEPTVQL